MTERSGVKVFRTTHLHNVAVECQMTVERDAKEFDLVRQCYCVPATLILDVLKRDLADWLVQKRTATFFQDS